MHVEIALLLSMAISTFAGPVSVPDASIEGDDRRFVKKNASSDWAGLRKLSRHTKYKESLIELLELLKYRFVNEKGQARQALLCLKLLLSEEVSRGERSEGGLGGPLLRIGRGNPKPRNRERSLDKNISRPKKGRTQNSLAQKLKDRSGMKLVSREVYGNQRVEGPDSVTLLRTEKGASKPRHKERSSNNKIPRLKKKRTINFSIQDLEERILPGSREASGNKRVESGHAASLLTAKRRGSSLRDGEHLWNGRILRRNKTRALNSLVSKLEARYNLSPLPGEDNGKIGLESVPHPQSQQDVPLPKSVSSPDESRVLFVEKRQPRGGKRALSFDVKGFKKHFHVDKQEFYVNARSDPEESSVLSSIARPHYWQTGEDRKLTGKFGNSKL